MRPGRNTSRAMAAIAVSVLTAGCTTASLAPAASESAALVPSASPAATPSVPQSALGLVVYNVTELIQPLPDNCTPSNHPWCHVQRIWIANADGSGARQLLTDAPGGQYAIAWTPDGFRILYEDSSCRLRFADAEGSVLETLPLETLYPAHISADPCDSADLSNRIDIGNGTAFSPDSARLAVVMSDPGDNGATITTIAIYDLETREVTRIEATRVTDTGTCSTTNGGVNSSPIWSPDGTQLLFDRQGFGFNQAGECLAAVFVVNADGTGLRAFVPPGARRNPGHARWSPDGSLIAYHYGEVAGPVDIFVMNPDGTGVRQLTTDGLSIFPEWTADGRVAFQRFPDTSYGDASEVWIMDTDGGGLIHLGQGESLADIIGPNCADCPYAFSEAIPGDNIPAGLQQPVP